MNLLWKNPKSIATILLNADRNDIKNNLSNFVVHNLYNNISSINNKEEQLIYIITILLKNEINSLKGIDSPFLNETTCGMILEKLSRKKEVIFFFKNIIIEILKLLENNFSSKNIFLNPYHINEVVKNLSAERKKELFNNIPNDKKEIINKYIKSELNEEEINKINLKYKDNKEMNDFLQRIKNDYKTIVSKLKNNNEEGIEEHAFSEPDILPYYENSLLKVIEIIDKILDKLNNSIDSLPFSIKCICKIISILIEKKYPKEIKVKRNRFLINFFFQCLFYSILMHPSEYAFINEYIITDSISNNLLEIMKILDNITFGVLFGEKYLLPLNIYTIDKMPKIFELFNRICQVELPNFIDKLVNDKLPKEYEYDYFKENPDENILYRNICYTIDDLISLIDNIQKFKDLTSFKNENLISILHKSIEKLKQKKQNFDKNNKKIEINMFLLTDSINNEKMTEILNLSKNGQNHFTLKELKKIENNQQEIQNNKIRVKNLFCSLLYKYKTLLKNNYKPENLSNIINILTELKNHSNTNSSLNIDNKYIIKWYLDSLIQNLPKLSKNIIQNDYAQLLNELEGDIKNSIKKFDFEELCIFIEHNNFLQREIIEYEKIGNIIIDIDLNSSTINLIKKIMFSFNTKDEQCGKFFKNIMENDTDFSKLFYKDIKNKNIFYNNITLFIDAFPNIVKRQAKIGNDYFEYLKQKKVPEIIYNYLNIIKNTIDKKKEYESEKSIKLYEKIYDYIMEQLYDKLFPKQTIFNDVDVKIYKNCYYHNWIKLSNLIKDNKINYMLDNYLPDSINYFKLFETEKSPRKKLLNINKLFECIYKLKECTGEKIDGVDDELVLLNYTFINSIPENITKVCRYTELFLGNKKLDIEGNNLMKILAICQKMENFSYKDLYNISKQEYDNNIKQRNVPKI